MLKDSPIYTEYLPDDIYNVAKEMYTLLGIKEEPTALCDIYSRLKHILSGTDEIKIVDTTEETAAEIRENIESFVSYIAKNCSNLKYCKGHEFFIGQQWLRANALFYQLKNTCLTQDQHQKYVITFEQTQASEQYYAILEQFRKLSNFIYRHNHKPYRASSDDVLQKAIFIASDKQFADSIQGSGLDDETKQYLLQIRTAVKLTLDAQCPFVHLLENKFFEDELKTIQDEMTRITLRKPEPQQHTSSTQNAKQSSSTSTKTEAQQPPTTTTTDQKSGAEPQQHTGSTQDEKQSSSSSSSSTSSESQKPKAEQSASKEQPTTEVGNSQQQKAQTTASTAEQKSTLKKRGAHAKPSGSLDEPWGQ